MRRPNLPLEALESRPLCSRRMNVKLISAIGGRDQKKLKFTLVQTCHAAERARTNERANEAFVEASLCSVCTTQSQNSISIREEARGMPGREEKRRLRRGREARRGAGFFSAPLSLSLSLSLGRFFSGRMSKICVRERAKADLHNSTKTNGKSRGERVGGAQGNKERGRERGAKR